MPWIPSQPGNGFEIPINSQRSQFIQTGSLDFSGVTITMNVDYIPVDPDGTGDATIAAVETQDFLGEVFPCVDPNTGDLLRVKMYTSVLTIQDWLQQHPGAQTACGIFIRYSPYDTLRRLRRLGHVRRLPQRRGRVDRAGRPNRRDATLLFNPGLLTQAAVGGNGNPGGGPMMNTDFVPHSVWPCSPRVRHRRGGVQRRRPSVS